MYRLPKKLLNRGPFTYTNALDEGLNQYALLKLIREGIIERVSRGMYISSNYDYTDPEAQYYLASLQCGKPSCICLLSALDYYHVTDLIPNKVWITVPQTKRVRSHNLKLIRTRNPHWDVGITKTNKYWITTLSRTLVECLLYKNRIGSTVALSALKTALHQKKVTLSDVITMANRLQIKHRIYNYIESLAS